MNTILQILRISSSKDLREFTELPSCLGGWCIPRYRLSRTGYSSFYSFGGDLITDKDCAIEISYDEKNAMGIYLLFNDHGDSAEFVSSHPELYKLLESVNVKD